MNLHIYEDETIEDLQCKGYKIIQKTKGFRFGIDAVLLARFAEIRGGDNIIDLGTGSGIIPVLLAAKEPLCRIIGVEIQKKIVDMAKRSIIMNNLEKIIDIRHGNLKEAEKEFGAAVFDVVVTNPPYTKLGSGLVNPKDDKAIARHEIYCTLEDVINVSSRLLKPNGSFFMVHKAARLVDIIFLMRKYRLEPKVVRFVHPRKEKAPNLVLIRGSKYGNAQLTILDPLYVHDEKGGYSDEIKRIYSIV